MTMFYFRGNPDYPDSFWVRPNDARQIGFIFHSFWRYTYILTIED